VSRWVGLTVEGLNRILPSASVVPAYTWATMPASYQVGQPVWISDIGDAVMGASPVAATGSLWAFNGTIWKPVSGRVTLAKLNTPITGLTNSEVVSAQLLLPAGFFKVGDRLEAMMSFEKSGTTDTGSMHIRMGTAGTTADTELNTIAAITAANRVFRGQYEFRVEAATTIARLNTLAGSFGGSASAAADVTIANISNALYINFGVVSSSTNDTVGLRDIVLTLIR